jgi:Flp pilus assembly pilin Flp
MIKFIKNFRKDEDGAVTVDWVVLTAAVVALGIGAISLLVDNTETLAKNIGESVGSGEVKTEVEKFGGSDD